MKRLLTLIAAIAVLGCAQVLAQDYVPTPVTVSREKVKLNGKVYLSHVVLEKQTLYSISKAYGVTEEDLYEANPSLRETGLQKNAILLVPYREEAAPAVQDYTEHIVRWYEDINDIARRYGVTVKDIMDANQLTGKKLSTRQVLRIPVVKTKTEEEKAEPAGEPLPPVPPVTVEEEVKADTLEVVPDSTLLSMRTRGSARFSLILPLRAAAGGSEMNMDFYSGVLMAMKDLEEEGVKVHMNVYDLNAGIPPVEELVKDDFVLGPVASRDLEAILQRVEGRVPVISPLDQKAAALTVNYRNFIQAPSATDHQYEDLAQWVKEDLRPTDKVILVTEKGADNVTASVAIRSALARRGMNYDILSYAIVEGRSIPATLAEIMAGKDSLTRVVVASESEAFTGDVVRNLGIMQGKGYDMVMYAPSRVRTFETIEGSAYHDAALHISTAYHVDYSDPKVERFVHAYRALFRTEPSQFAFQGYDTARFFFSRASRYGRDWSRSLGTDRVSGLHTDFLFTPKGEKGYINTAVRRILYKKDYSTVIDR